MSRLFRGLGALAVLIATVLGVPLGLAVLGGNPLPRALSWAAVQRALLRPDDGSILISLITVVGWLAWLVFASSVLAEVVELASRRRIRITLPGLGGPRRLAAGLLISVVAMMAVAQTIAQASVPPHPAAELAETGGSADRSGFSATADRAGGGQHGDVEAPGAGQSDGGSARVRSLAADADGAARGTGPGSFASIGNLPAAAAAHGGPHQQVHVVVEGDDLWSLAEQFYGSGSEWRRIAMANPSRLTGGPDRLLPGWRLVIPDGAAKTADSTPVVAVRSGDTLSSVAERAYGDASAWPRLLDANRAQISDPDELVPGMRLVVPRVAEDDGRGAVARDGDHADPGGGRPGADDRPGGERTGADGDSEEPAGGRSGTQRPGGGATTAPTATTTQDSPPTTTAPTAPTATSAAGQTATESATPTADHEARTSEGTGDSATIAAGLGSVGALLAAGVIGGLALRRRAQLQSRPLGRRIVPISDGATRAEVILGQRQRPMSLRTLDLATRAIAVHCRRNAVTLPPLRLVRVGADEIELLVPAATMAAPPGFRTRGASWVLDRTSSAELGSESDIEAALRPYPGLVTIGRDSAGRDVLVDLEAVGLLSIDAVPSEGGDRTAQSVLVAIAVELSFSPWVDELALTLVGEFGGLPEALGRHNVVKAELDDVLDRLEQRAKLQREQHPYAVLGQHRMDPDLAEPWTPEILLIDTTVDAGQRRRLTQLLTSEPRVTMAAVVAGRTGDAPWTLELQTSTAPRARLQPVGVTVTPQVIDVAGRDAVVELVAATGSGDSVAAPWWPDPAEEPDPPPDNITYLGRRFGGWASESTDGDTAMAQKWTVAAAAHAGLHPVLQMLGPINLVGATGPSPQRAARQCLEYCGWLLEHPGTSAMGMASALAVAEGTRRSNMSRLRTWLGTDPDGEAYLPEAYTGRIVLHPAVSSDWQRFQIITSAGVNKATTSALRAALELVRGAPLADAAPGQWHWAEGLRTDMISAIRDLGVELARRALESGDLDLARWAASRSLAAAPGDELLMAARIRTEHLAGNRAETERLTLQVAGHARTLGIDLDPETVSLLQMVMEGQVRARLA